LPRFHRFLTTSKLISLRLIDLGIIIYAALIVIVIATGGFKIYFMGKYIKATHVYTPLKILIPLILVRIFLSIEIKNSILLIASLIFCLIGSEIAIRIWNFPISKPGLNQLHQPSPSLGWELIPEAFGTGSLGEFYKINSLGYRGPEFTVKRQIGIHRIMITGDSFTFGSGVNYEDTYGAQLGKILNDKNIHCEVINCGVIGYQMWQNYEKLERKLLPYQPDLIILGLFQDDLSASVTPYTDSERYKGGYPFQTNDIHGFMNRFAIWNVLKNINDLIEYRYRYKRGYTYLKGIEERKKVLGPSNPSNQNYKIMSGKIEDQKKSAFSATLVRFVEKARKAGAKVLVVMIPDAVQLNNPHMQMVNQFIEEICKRIDVPFVDTTYFMESEKDYLGLYLFPFDAHNSRRGYQIIAQSIANHIIKFNMLENNIKKQL